MQPVIRKQKEIAITLTAIKVEAKPNAGSRMET
jgi:hypothetical protein